MAIRSGRLAPEQNLIFIRHGETDWNVERRLQGQKDTPLNDHGREQAARNGRALRSIEGIAEYDFAASPLARAADTMRIIRRELGLAPHEFRTDEGLLEITFGAWEGSTLAELAIDRPDDVHRRQADKWNFVPPGGESYEMLDRRIRSWVAGIEHDTVAVSHGAVGRVLQGLLTGADPRDIPSLPSPQDRALIWEGGAVRWI